MLNAIPDSAPGNCTSSSKPAPRSPETVSIPVETDVRAPISRGVRFGTNASRARLRLLNVRSRAGSRLSVAMLGFQSRRRRFRLDERSDTLGQGEQVVCDAPSDFHPSHRELDAANKLRRCLKASSHSRALALVDRV